MIKKTKLYAYTGIILLMNFVFLFVVFLASFKDKKGSCGVLYALALSFGAAGAALIALYASKERLRITDLKEAIAEKDHWFHSFEYPETREPKVKIETDIIPKVETEDDEEL